jgi:hypothetical protein
MKPHSPLPTSPPAPRHVVRWIMTAPDRLTEALAEAQRMILAAI